MGRVRVSTVLTRTGVAKRSEGQFLVAVTRGRRWTQVWGTARAAHGQNQDQKGLVQAGFVELRSLAENFSDQVVSHLEFFQGGERTFHRRGG